MEGYVKLNRLSVISIVSAVLMLLFYLLIFVLYHWFPPQSLHNYPFYIVMTPLFWLLGAAPLFLGPAALIAGINALKRINKRMGTEKGKILALIGLIIGGIQTALIAAAFIIIIIALISILQY